MLVPLGVFLHVRRRSRLGLALLWPSTCLRLYVLDYALTHRAPPGREEPYARALIATALPTFFTLLASVLGTWTELRR